MTALTASAVVISHMISWPHHESRQVGSSPAQFGSLRIARTVRHRKCSAQTRGTCSTMPKSSAYSTRPRSAAGPLCSRGRARRSGVRPVRPTGIRGQPESSSLIVKSLSDVSRRGSAIAPGVHVGDQRCFTFEHGDGAAIDARGQRVVPAMWSLRQWVFITRRSGLGLTQRN